MLGLDLCKLALFTAPRAESTGHVAKAPREYSPVSLFLLHSQIMFASLVLARKQALAFPELVAHFGGAD